MATDAKDTGAYASSTGYKKTLPSSVAVIRKAYMLTAVLT